MNTQETITAFLDSLNTASTRKAYGTALKHFCSFLQGREDAEPLTVDHAVAFVPWLRKERDHLSRATVQNYLTAVYRFYRHRLLNGAEVSAVDLARLEEKYRDARNIRGERKPKEPKLEVVLAVIAAAYAVPESKWSNVARLRDIAIVETLRATGCRVGELVRMRAGDIDPDARCVLTKGKGNKWRKVYWDAESWKAVCDYLLARERVLDDTPVFAGYGNRNAGALSTRHVARIVRGLAKQAGVAGEGVTPHYFRHVFATRALDRTDNLAIVQDMMGHASPVTTRVYARTDDAQRQAAHKTVWEEQG